MTATASVTYDTVAPPVPVSLNGTTPTGSNPALTWTSGGPDTLSGFDHYEIQRAGATIGTSTSPAFTHTGASSGSNVYTVKAVDAAGNVLGPVRVEVDRLRQRPARPADQPRGRQPDELPALSWTAPADVSGIDRYEVFRDGVSTVPTTRDFTDTAVAGRRHVRLHGPPSTTRATAPLLGRGGRSSSTARRRRCR